MIPLCSRPRKSKICTASVVLVCPLTCLRSVLVSSCDLVRRCLSVFLPSLRIRKSQTNPHLQWWDHPPRDRAVDSRAQNLDVNTKLVHKIGCKHKFGINVKHKTHDLALELHNYVNENINIKALTLICLLGLWFSRKWDCWVSSLIRSHRLLIETTQLMFHTWKCKGIVQKYVLQRVLYTTVSCVDIFIVCVCFLVIY